VPSRSIRSNEGEPYQVPRFARRFAYNTWYGAAQLRDLYQQLVRPYFPVCAVLTDLFGCAPSIAAFVRSVWAEKNSCVAFLSSRRPRPSSLLRTNSRTPSTPECPERTPPCYPSNVQAARNGGAPLSCRSFGHARHFTFPLYSSAFASARLSSAWIYGPAVPRCALAQP